MLNSSSVGFILGAGLCLAAAVLFDFIAGYLEPVLGGTRDVEDPGAA